MTTRTDPAVADDHPGPPTVSITIGVMAWGAVVVAAVLWAHEHGLDPAAGISAAPFYGHWDWHAHGQLLIAVVVGMLAVAVGPIAARRVSVPVLALGSGLSAALWSVVVAVSDGWMRLSTPMSSRYEYLPFVSTIHSARRFVDTYVDRAERYPTHVKGHPPGATLVFWALDRVGLGGPRWAALLVIIAWGVGIAAVVWAVARVADADVARRAAPFLVLAPAVVFSASSADALVAGVSALGLAAVSVAATGRGARHDALAVGAGLVLGWTLYMSYGVVPLLVIPLAVAVSRRRVRPLVLAGAGAAVVAAAFTAAGFWWPDGLGATRGFYAEGLAAVRPYRYFLVGNLAALALTVGPATGAGLGAAFSDLRRRNGRHPEIWLCLPALAAVLVADLSGLSKGEVERIWLPFVPWLLLGAAALPRRGVRGWLTAQVGLTLAIQAWLVTPW